MTSPIKNPFLRNRNTRLLEFTSVWKTFPEQAWKNGFFEAADVGGVTSFEKR
jgi:hypothetical protein